MLLNRVLKFFITIFSIILGATLLEFASPILAYIISAEFLQINLDILDMTLMNALSIVIGGIIGGSIGFISSSYCINKLRIFSIWVERQLSKMPTHDVVAGVLGLAIGLIIANLLGVAFSRVPLIGPYIPIIFSIVFGYLGLYITIKNVKILFLYYQLVIKTIFEKKISLMLIVKTLRILLLIILLLTNY